METWFWGYSRAENWTNCSSRRSRSCWTRRWHAPLEQRRQRQMELWVLLLFLRILGAWACLSRGQFELGWGWGNVLHRVCVGEFLGPLKHGSGTSSLIFMAAQEQYPQRTPMPATFHYLLPTHYTPPSPIHRHSQCSNMKT